MSFAEMKEALVTLSPEQRAELEERIHALDEGITVEQLREINAIRGIDCKVTLLHPNLNAFYGLPGFSLEGLAEYVQRALVG